MMLRAQKIDCFLYRSILSNRIQSAIRHTSSKKYYGRRFLSYVWLPEIFEFCYLVLHNKGANLFLVYHSWQSNFIQIKNGEFFETSQSFWEITLLWNTLMVEMIKFDRCTWLSDSCLAYYQFFQCQRLPKVGWKI